MSVYTTVINPDAGSEDDEFLNQMLREFNTTQVGYRDTRPLSVMVRDLQGRLAGGLYGLTRWNWLSIELLWLAEPARGQGIGSRLVRLAEEEARARGCQRSQVDTMSFQSPEFYIKLGYEIFGVLDGYAGEHKRYYMQKILR